MRHDAAALNALVLQSLPTQGGMGMEREDAWLDTLVMECLPTLGPETVTPRFKGKCYAGSNCTGKVLHNRVLHCHNCKKYVSGKSLRRPSGTCENC
jgi:hypothetical protein